MAEFSIDKFKYRWQGDWTTATAYRRDDIIRVGGKSYVCLIAHTSNALFRADLNATLPGSTPPEPQPKWVVMTSGRTFLGNWATETVYDKGDIVNFQGSLYICSYNHTTCKSKLDIICCRATISTNLDYRHRLWIKRCSKIWRNSIPMYSNS